MERLGRGQEGGWPQSEGPNRGGSSIRRRQSRASKRLSRRPGHSSRVGLRRYFELGFFCLGQVSPFPYREGHRTAMTWPKPS